MSVLGWEGTWGGIGRSRGRGILNQDILCEEKKSIFKKRKIKSKTKLQLVLCHLPQRAPNTFRMGHG